MFRGFINNAMKMNKYNIRIRTFANATNNNNSKIGLSQVVPSNISVVSAVKKKKQAITNVLFSFLTCVLGAQVIRYRYMKDEVDDELNTLQQKYNKTKATISGEKLQTLCNDMNINEKQKNILFQYFQPLNSNNIDVDNNNQNETTNGVRSNNESSEVKKDSKPVKSFRI